jgi:hypothetical protein
MDPRILVRGRHFVLALLWCLFCTSNARGAEAPIGSAFLEEAAYWERVGTWKDLRFAVDTQNRENAFNALNTYLRELKLSGISSERDVLAAASLRARQAARAGEHKRARLWLEVAAALDRHGAGVHSAQVEVGIQGGPSGWLWAPIYLTQLVYKGFENPASRMNAWSLFGLIVSLALSLAALLFLSASASRKLPYLRHRLDHWAVFPLPGGLFQAWAFGAILVALTLGYGLLPPLLMLTALLAVFHTEKDRLVLVLLLVAMGALPSLSHWFWSHEAYQVSGMANVERCEEGSCAFFKEAALQWPLEAENHYGKGLMLARRADLIGAEIELKKAQNEGLSDVGVDVALGNVMLLRLVTRCPHGYLTPDLARWVKDAKEYFTKAEVKDQALGAVQYGLALSEKLLGNNGRASQHLQRYMDSSGAEPAFPGFSRLTVCPGPGESMLGKVLWPGLSTSHKDDVAQRIIKTRGMRNLLPLQEWMLGSLHVRELALYSLLLALFILLLGASTSRALGCGRCSRCSDLFCSRCVSTDVHVPLCQKCLMDRLQIAIADPQDVWRRQVRHDRRDLRLGRWILILGLILPGYGSVLRGRFLRGLVLLSLTSIGFVFLLGPTGLLAGWPAFGSAGSASYAPAVWVLFPTYLFGSFETRRASRVELK